MTLFTVAVYINIITDKFGFYCVARRSTVTHRQTAYIATEHKTIVAPEGISAMYDNHSPISDAPKHIGIDKSTMEL